LFVFLAILDIIRGRLLVRIGASLDESLSARVYDAAVRSPSRVGNRREGIQPLRDLDNIRSFLSGDLSFSPPNTNGRSGPRRGRRLACYRYGDGWSLGLASAAEQARLENPKRPSRFLRRWLSKTSVRGATCELVVACAH